MLRTCAWLLMTVFAVGLAAKEKPKFSVFIQPPTRDGFVDADRGVLDSIKDLRTSLGWGSRYQLAERKELADVVVTVYGRGAGSEQFGQLVSANASLNNLTVTTLPLTRSDYWIAATIEVGAYRKIIFGRYSSSAPFGPWSTCADNLFKEIRSWIDANVEQLAAHRAKSERP